MDRHELETVVISRRALGIEPVVVNQDLQTWLQTIFNKGFGGIAFWGETGGYIDPTWFLDQFKGSSTTNPTGWADARFEALLSQATITPDRQTRMPLLAEAERQLLRGMPFLPLDSDARTYPRKPFVQGLRANALDLQQWKYARIDRNWRHAV
jgi:oligopeptide transport system substrate-binding protein